MPYAKDIRKMGGHISPEMRRAIHEIMSGLHEKVSEYVIIFLAKYGTSTVQVDRIYTSKQNYSSTFFTYSPQNIDNQSNDKILGI